MSLNGEGAAPPPAGSATTKGRDRNKTGFLLLTVGFALSAIPYVSIAGIIILLVGVLLAFLGASAYGPQHKRYAKWAILSWVLVFIGFLVALFATLFPVFLGFFEGVPRDELRASWLGFLVALGVGLALFAVPYLLLPYRLLSKEERKLGWAAAGVHAVNAGLVAWYADRLFDPILDIVAAGGDITEVQAAQLSDPGFFLFGWVNLLWAVLYYLAYRRASRGAVAPPGTAPA